MTYLTNLGVCVVSLAREHDNNQVFGSECSTNLTSKSITYPEGVVYYVCSNHEDQIVPYRYMNENCFPELEMIAIGIALYKGNYETNIITMPRIDDRWFIKLIFKNMPRQKNNLYKFS